MTLLIMMIIITTKHCAIPWTYAPRLRKAPGLLLGRVEELVGVLLVEKQMIHAAEDQGWPGQLGPTDGMRTVNLGEH